MNEYTYSDPVIASTGESVLGLFMMAFLTLFFLYFAFMQFRIASVKTGNADIAWFAFIPILNTILLIQMAGKPMWWIFLLLIPVVNIVAFFALWVEVAKACDQSPVWGFLTMIPPISFISIFILAYGSRPIDYSDPSPSKPKAPVHS